MTLYDYQQSLIDSINAKSATKRLCVQLSTGGGKTVIFSHIANNNATDTLILVDADELVSQTAATVRECCTFQAKDKRFPTTRVVVAMSQTIWSRAQKDAYFLQRFRTIIVDECHVFVHNKLFDLFDQDAKIIGFTATPVRSSRISFLDEDGEEWTREQLMSDTYDDIVCGIGIDQLIARGYLVDEELYCIDVKGVEKLRTNASGEFTNESLNDVFDNEKYAIDILTEYKSKCHGQKTLIFTPTTEVNLRMFMQFKEAGINVEMYDSVNSHKSNRVGIVDWFRDTPDAVLLNVGCFTKGFDVKDVECIILARAVGSLSLFIQIAGRGARTTDKIYKDKFIFIDGGKNSERFGMWSAPRDWERMFWKGLKPPKKKKEDVLDIETCDGCGCLKLKSEVICPGCGFEKPISEGKSKPQDKALIETTKAAKIVYPDAKKIIEFCERRGEDKFFALNLLVNEIFKMFVTSGVTIELINATIINGKFEERMKDLLRKNYGQIIKSDLQSKSNRTYNYVFTQLVERIDKHFGYERVNVGSGFVRCNNEQAYELIAYFTKNMAIFSTCNRVKKSTFRWKTKLLRTYIYVDSRQSWEIPECRGVKRFTFEQAIKIYDNENNL
jgi:superfamily II DNA or RNA helicase